ncbi:MAG: hypothetical protein IKX26_03450 [Bacteroidales bacterium]|nr:hypothetical protein [Bacteroidales bacterium]
MKKVLTKSILFSAMVLGLALASCTGKPKEQPAEEPAAATVDSALVAAAENNLKAHQEDIQTLWYLAYGDKKISGYSLANDYVYLSSEDGKDALLLSFYKDMKDIDNFDGIPVTEGQEVSFQGDAVVVKGFGQTTYFVKTENEGFKQLFTESEKDGKKVFNDDLGEPFGEAEAQAFIENLSKEEATKLSDILVKWKTE